MGNANSLRAVWWFELGSNTNSLRAVWWFKFCSNTNSLKAVWWFELGSPDWKSDNDNHYPTSSSTNKCYMHKTEFTLKNETRKLLRDRNQTSNPSHWRRTYHLLDFTVPANHGVKIMGDFSREQKKLCNIKFSSVSWGCRIHQLHLYREVWAPHFLWLFGWVLWHINPCRLFNAKSIFIQINSSLSNNSVKYKYTF